MEEGLAREVAYVLPAGVSLGSSCSGKNKYGSWGPRSWFPKTFCAIGKNSFIASIKNKVKILFLIRKSQIQCTFLYFNPGSLPRQYTACSSYTELRALLESLIVQHFPSSCYSCPLCLTNFYWFFKVQLIFVFCEQLWTWKKELIIPSHAP